MMHCIELQEVQGGGAQLSDIAASANVIVRNAANAIDRACAARIL